ncbi:MAG: hypothetical protein ACE5IH_04265 [Thermodesulfobacteriota bacterium]
MAKISKDEKKELIEMARSPSLKEDMKRLLVRRHNPVMVNGKVDIDRLITFLTDFSEFINHRPKPFKPIIDKVMKL